MALKVPEATTPYVETKTLIRNDLLNTGYMYTREGSPSTTGSVHSSFTGREAPWEFITGWGPRKKQCVFQCIGARAYCLMLFDDLKSKILGEQNRFL